MQVTETKDPLNSLEQMESSGLLWNGNLGTMQPTGNVKNKSVTGRYK